MLLGVKGGVFHGVQTAELAVGTDVSVILCKKRDHQMKEIKDIKLLVYTYIHIHRNFKGKRQPVESTFIESLLWGRHSAEHTTYYLI